MGLPRQKHKPTLRPMNAKWFRLSALVCLGAVCPVQGSEALIAADAYISAARPKVKLGGAPVLIVGRNERTLLRFDLSALPSGLPPEQVAKATLQLWQVSATRTGVVKVYPVESAWTEATVIDATAPTLGATEAGSFTVTAGDKKVFAGVDVTALVREWVTGTRANQGLALVPLVAGAQATFDSKEATATSHEPKLEIVLSGPVGPMGLQGEKGDKGDTGDVGLRGLTGDKGDKGDTGPATPLPLGTATLVATGQPAPAGYTDSAFRVADWRVFNAQTPANTDFAPRLLVAGSRLFLGRTSNIREFNLQTNDWSATDSVIGAASSTPAGAPDGKIYFFGGFQGQLALKTVTSYDPATGATGSLPNMPVGGTPYEALFVNGHAFAFFDTAFNAIYDFDVASQQWSLLPRPTPDIYEVPGGFAATRVGNALCVLTPVGIYQLIPGGGPWTLTRFPYASDFAAVELSSTELLLFRGVDGRAFRVNRVTGATSQEATFPGISFTVFTSGNGEIFAFACSDLRQVVRCRIDSFGSLYFKSQ